MTNDHSSSPQHQQPRDDAARELAEVQAALDQMVRLLITIHDDRVVAVGTKFAEVLGGQAVLIKQEQPPWPLDWQADWIDSQLEAIETNLAKLATELPDELRGKVGAQIVDDHLDALRVRTAELFGTIREVCNKVLQRELPVALTYRAQRKRN